MRHFEVTKRRHDRLFRFVSVMIVLTFIATLLGWLFVGILVYDTATEIENQGIKGVVEQLWCGKQNPNCS